MTTSYLLAKLCLGASVEDDGSWRLLLPNRLSKLRFFAAAHGASPELMILDEFAGWSMNDGGCPILNRMEAVMTTYYDFQSGRDPTLHAFTDTPSEAKLPKEFGPWTFVHEVASGDLSHYPVARIAVDAGVLENGFFLWGTDSSPHSAKRVVESDRVEGTAVYDSSGHRIGTIKRLLIEKVSGRVLYVDVTFGGFLFLGLGTHHYTIPWEKLAYDTALGGYRTDVTEEQVKGAPTFWEDQDWLDHEREKEAEGYWRISGPI